MYIYIYICLCIYRTQIYNSLSSFSLKTLNNSLFFWGVPVIRFPSLNLCLIPRKYHAPAARTVSLESEGTMEGDTFRLGNGGQIDGKVVQTVQKSFVQVQNILDQNRLLINEINQNHESKIPDNLGRNVGLIRELNNNIRRVVDLYADLSTSVSKSTDLASSEADSKGGGNKRNRPA